MASRRPAGRRLLVVLLGGALCLGASARGGTPTSAPAADPLPALVAPWPTGLSGTVVFESDVAGRPGLYVLDMARGRVRRLTGSPEYRDQTPRWSPDGTRIVFSSNRAHYTGASPDTGTPDFDLWTIGPDGGDARRVTADPANEQDPAWTADGGSLVFSSDRDSRGDLYTLRVDSGATTRLTRHFAGRAIMPAPAPAGPQRIAFAAQSLRLGAFWSYQIHVLDTVGRSPALDSAVGGCWPRWSPDGTKLAYVHSGSGETPSTLEVRSGPGLSASTLLAADGLWTYYPAWSPDGQRLVFSVSPAHHEGEDWDLAVMDVATGRWTPLTRGRGNDRLPDWAP
ncbi:MAG: hypothetical protein R2708_13685 [Vicinamibacterales bacterium]